MQEGCFYHIYNRGNNKTPIFFEEKNYMYFLNKLDKYLSGSVDIYAYCLMPNHFHLLIKVKARMQTSEVFKTSEVLPRKLSPAEKAFKDFFISYAKSINKAYNRTGSLFQAKFKKKGITDDGYFTTIIRYIHANPVKAELCSKFEDYRYSSYNAILSTYNTKIKREEVLNWFGGKEMFLKMHEARRREIQETGRNAFLLKRF